MNHADPAIARAATVEKLAAAHDITQVLHRYASAVDRLDAERLASCFHPDATDDHGLFVGPVSDFVPWVIGYVGAWVSTQHDISTPIIDVDGDTALVECHWTGYYRFPVDGQVVDQLACGRYLDRFERRDGEWRIAHRTCVTDWTRDLGPVTPSAPHRLSGRRDTSDLSYHLAELAVGYRVAAQPSS